jgi:hypothetical protein
MLLLSGLEWTLDIGLESGLGINFGLCFEQELNVELGAGLVMYLGLGYVAEQVLAYRIGLAEWLGTDLGLLLGAYLGLLLLLGRCCGVSWGVRKGELFSDVGLIKLLGPAFPCTSFSNNRLSH